MHSTDTVNQFIELRAQGWSLARIAKQLNVAQRTLVDWHAQHKDGIAKLQSHQLEALHERILLSYEEQLTRLSRQLTAIETQIDQAQYKYEKNTDLHRMAAMLRAEIRKACLFQVGRPRANRSKPQIPPHENCTVSASFLPHGWMGHGQWNGGQNQKK